MEKEAEADDTESNVNAELQAEITAKREAVKKEARREGVRRAIFMLMLLAIFAFEQFAVLKGMLIRARVDEDTEDYVIVDLDDDQTDIIDGYNLYYNSMYGRINWTKVYYPCVFLLPAVFLIARVSFILPNGQTIIELTLYISLCICFLD